MFKKENLRKNFLRVKQIADQNLGRVEKTEVISDDLQVSEKRVELVKQACTNTVKKLSTSLSTGPDVEKRHKKMPEAMVGHSMIESSGIIGQESIMGQMYQMCGDCEITLAQKHLQYELDVENNTLKPMEEILEVEIPHIGKLKKALNKLTLDMDSAKSRWNNAVRQTQVPGTNMATASAKADTVKDEYEEAASRVEQAKDAYTTGMLNFISKEADHSQNLVNLLEAQAKYHRESLEVIEAMIPKMKETLNCNPIKPVYGVPLEEHLRVTNRDIAQVLEACVCYLLEGGLDEEGLFRIAGMASKVKKLKASFDAGVDLDDNGDLDPHTVAGALKQYLRELPEPLLTFNLFPDFMAAAQQPQEKKLQALWCVVDRLPKPNYDNFRYLVKFLAKLTEKSDVNKMTPGNISIVIGPNLIWSEGDNGPNMMNTGILSMITELIIQHADWFFPGDVKFECGSSVGSESPKLDSVTTTTNTHAALDRTSSDHSDTSLGTPQSSPAVSEATSPAAPPQTPPTTVKSKSVSPAGSHPNLPGAPLAESEDIQPVVRRVVRKPAPPPPQDRPYSVAVSASVKANTQQSPFQTWPRQAAPPPEEENSMAPQSHSDKRKTLPPERPSPPERVSSLSSGSQHHTHHERPKIPPPVVPPKHTRSASTGSPFVPYFDNQDHSSATGSPNTNSRVQGDTAPLSGSTSQLTPQENKQYSTNSLHRLSYPRPSRPMPPPPPPPADIVEETHL